MASLVPMLEDAGFTAQPRETSRIVPFPFNVGVKNAALWAIRSLRDGRQPFPPSDLSGFPGPPKADGWLRAELPRFRAWWKENGEDEAYRYRAE